jgi:hypothetical protein
LSNILKRAHATAGLQDFIKEARKTTWRDVHVIDRGKLRIALILKHGSLTKAAENLDIQFIRLSSVINGRENTVALITAIQFDLSLTDDQVLNLWPLLKIWPRQSRAVS